MFRTELPHIPSSSAPHPRARASRFRTPTRNEWNCMSAASCVQKPRGPRRRQPARASRRGTMPADLMRASGRCPDAAPRSAHGRKRASPRARCRRARTCLHVGELVYSCCSQSRPRPPKFIGFSATHQFLATKARRISHKITKSQSFVFFSFVLRVFVLIFFVFFVASIASNRTTSPRQARQNPSGAAVSPSPNRPVHSILLVRHAHERARDPCPQASAGLRDDVTHRHPHHHNQRDAVGPTRERASNARPRAATPESGRQSRCVTGIRPPAPPAVVPPGTTSHGIPRGPIHRFARPPPKTRERRPSPPTRFPSRAARIINR